MLISSKCHRCDKLTIDIRAHSMCYSCATFYTLERIASAAPSLHRNGPINHTCSLCAAHIDEARAVLGWAPLPAAPRTPLNPAPETPC